MKHKHLAPILIINATELCTADTAPLYEFILDESLTLLHAGYVTSLAKETVLPADIANLKGLLFEWNHVRVNPHVNNTRILVNMADALGKAGVFLRHPPSQDSMAICFKPLGELSDVVRFYIDQNSRLIFLSRAVKLKLI